mgnify:CR=1 FL=1|tara:strand:+ start:64 stop:417 length:354 start_codon:yes stop_codon:yes gene_type:complete
MHRIVIYSIVLGVFALITNLLRYDNNFNGLSYDSSIVDVITYVSCSFSGCGYIGVYPISKTGKILIILLSILKYLMLIEGLIMLSTPLENYNIYKGVEGIVNLEGNILSEVIRTKGK